MPRPRKCSWNWTPGGACRAWTPLSAAGKVPLSGARRHRCTRSARTAPTEPARPGQESRLGVRPSAAWFVVDGDGGRQRLPACVGGRRRRRALGPTGYLGGPESVGADGQVLRRLRLRGPPPVLLDSRLPNAGQVVRRRGLRLVGDRGVARRDGGRDAGAWVQGGAPPASGLATAEGSAESEGPPVGAEEVEGVGRRGSGCRTDGGDAGGGLDARRGGSRVRPHS